MILANDDYRIVEMDLVDKVSKRVDSFISNNSAFIIICDQCFIAADKNSDGRISPEEISAQISIIFEYLKDALKSYSIDVIVPSKARVRELLGKADLNHDNYLDKLEFVLFYTQVSGC